MSDAVARASVRVCVFFFFIGFAPNRADLAKLGPYRPYRVVSAGGRYGRNRPETAETCRKRPKSALNMAGKSETCLLLSFFCESRHSNVFFKNILIVKIYRKLNKNIFNRQVPPHPNPETHPCYIDVGKSEIDVGQGGTTNPDLEHQGRSGIAWVLKDYG